MSEISKDYPLVLDRKTGNIFGGKKGTQVELQGSLVRVKRVGTVVELPIDRTIVQPGKAGSVRIIPVGK